MEITLKLFATLTDYLPPGAGKHEISLDVPDDTTPAAIIKQFNLPAELVHLVLVNGTFVSPEDRGTKPLRERDELAIFPPIAGG